MVGGLVFGLWGCGTCFLANVHAGFRGFVKLLRLANGFLKGRQNMESLSKLYEVLFSNRAAPLLRI